MNMDLDFWKILGYLISAIGGGLVSFFSIKYKIGKEAEEWEKLKLENEKKQREYVQEMESLILKYQEKLLFFSNEILEMSNQLNAMKIAVQDANIKVQNIVKEKEVIDFELQIIREKCKDFINY